MADDPKRRTGLIAMIGAAVLLVLTLAVIAMQSTEREELPRPGAPEAVTPVPPDLEVSPDVTKPPAVPPPPSGQPPRVE
jgi:hypothetical protein